MIDNQEVVVLRGGEIDQLRVISLFFVISGELNWNTLHEQTMKGTVILDKTGMIRSRYEVNNCVEYGRREVWIDTLYSLGQSVFQNNGPVVSSLWGIAFRRNVWAVGIAPARILEPLQAELLELGFGDGHEIFSALKGRFNPAQGNALGS